MRSMVICATGLSKRCWLVRSEVAAFGVGRCVVGVSGALFVFMWRGAAEPNLFDIPLSFRVLFIAIIGGSIVTANWFLLLTSLFPFAFLVVRTRIEEEKLVERFGDEYRDYIARTGRFWPRLSR